jgi:hypothetical protein
MPSSSPSPALLILGEAVRGDGLGQPPPEQLADPLEVPAHRRLADAELLRDRLARLPVEDAHAVHLELEEVRLRLGLADRRVDLRPEDALLVRCVGLQGRRLGHEPLVELGGLAAGAALECHAPVDLVAQRVLGDRQQPRREARPAAGVVAVDRVRQGGQRLLGEVADRLDPDPAPAPLGQLRPQHRAEHLPELEPRALIAIAQALHK